MTTGDRGHVCAEHTESQLLTLRATRTCTEILISLSASGAPLRRVGCMVGFLGIEFCSVPRREVGSEFQVSEVESNRDIEVHIEVNFPEEALKWWQQPGWMGDKELGVGEDAARFSPE